MAEEKDAIFNEVLLGLLSEEDQTTDQVNHSVSCLRDSTDEFMAVLNKVADSHFDTDAMEKVYHLKSEYLDKVCVFLGNSSLMTITERIEVLAPSSRHS